MICIASVTDAYLLGEDDETLHKRKCTRHFEEEE